MHCWVAGVGCLMWGNLVWYVPVYTYVYVGLVCPGRPPLQVDNPCSIGASWGGLASRTRYCRLGNRLMYLRVKRRVLVLYLLHGLPILSFSLPLSAPRQGGYFVWVSLPNSVDAQGETCENWFVFFLTVVLLL